jgi:hypothetical protein
MTPQEIFDTVALHLIAQGYQAEGVGGDCMYRAPDGSKCAVGCLITDEEYVPSMEMVAFGGRGIERQIAWPPRLLVHKRLLQELQQVHDQDDRWRRLHEELYRVALKFELSADVLR